MSTLNELKRLTKGLCNDAELGAAVRDYFNRNKSCCDYEKNLEAFEDPDTHPRGTVRGTRCRECGSLVDFEIDR